MLCSYLLLNSTHFGIAFRSCQDDTCFSANQLQLVASNFRRGDGGTVDVKACVKQPLTVSSELSRPAQQRSADIVSTGDTRRRRYSWRRRASCCRLQLQQIFHHCLPERQRTLNAERDEPDNTEGSRTRAVMFGRRYSRSVQQGEGGRQIERVL